MIGEALSVINNNPQLVDAAYLRHKAEVARTVASSIPESVRQTAENLRASRKRALGATALAATNVALLYGDDVAVYGVFSQMKGALESSASAGTATAMIAAGGLSAAIQIALARKNQNFLSNSSVVDPRIGQNESEEKTSGFIERMRSRFKRVKQHAGKLAVSLSVGVPMNALTRKLTKNEVYGHAAAYGTASALIYETANVSLSALDSPAAPVILVGGILASRYVTNACERAAAGSEDTVPANTPLMSDDEAEFVVAWGKR